MTLVIAIMAKCPAAQDVKTRLSPRLDREQRARLYEAFFVDKVHAVCALTDVRSAIVYTPERSRSWFEARAPECELVAQHKGELGARVIAAYDALFARGASAVVLTDSDSPSLPARYLADAADALRSGSELVVGPAADGGFFLLGLRQPRPELFEGVPWSTSAALSRMLANARGLGLAPRLLSPWYDVDEPQDLEQLASDVAHGRGEACPHTEAALRALGLIA